MCSDSIKMNFFLAENVRFSALCQLAQCLLKSLAGHLIYICLTRQTIEQRTFFFTLEPNHTLTTVFWCLLATTIMNMIQRIVKQISQWLRDGCLISTLPFSGSPNKHHQGQSGVYKREKKVKKSWTIVFQPQNSSTGCTKTSSSHASMCLKSLDC